MGKVANDAADRLVVGSSRDATGALARLQTLHEELQATVEELSTTHEDIEARAHLLQELRVSLEQQQALAESERSRLAAVLSAMRDAVLVVDRDGAPVMRNAAYDELTLNGEPVPEDDRGQPLPPEDGLRLRAARGDTFTLTYRAVDRHGQRRWYEVVGQPIARVSAEHTGGGVLVIRDITERSLRQMQDEFVAIVAHELRTPLTALQGYLQLLVPRVTAGTRDAPEARYATLALEQAERLRNLVADLFDSARLQTGRLSLELVELNLVQLVRDAIGIAQSLTASQRIEFDATDENIWVRADIGRLQQVVMNLVTNAIRHAPHSERIGICVRREGDEAIIEIEDAGPGIDPTDIPHLFSRLHPRRESTTKRGLGLGLFISHEIVVALGGSIGVDSEVGRGTKMMVRLPAIVAPVPGASDS